MKIGITAGAFDLCHAGHMRAFRNAKEHCEYLVVALHRDPSIERPEKHKPIMSIEERREMLEGIKYVDYIVEYDTESELKLILCGQNAPHPHVRFLGTDWKDKEYTGRELNIPIVWESREHGHSSSELRKRIALAEPGAVLTDMKNFLPDFMDCNYPKGETDSRGVATVACALFLLEYGQSKK